VQPVTDVEFAGVLKLAEKLGLRAKR